MDRAKISSHKDLIVWQKSMDLVVLVYACTEYFPKAEQYGITSQIRRSAISIPSNIAEGQRRGTKKDFRKFLHIAFGSGAELETQIELAKRLDFLTKEDYSQANNLLTEILKMLNVLIRKLGETNE